jgi:hypothetical protein
MSVSVPRRAALLSSQHAMAQHLLDGQAEVEVPREVMLACYDGEPAVFILESVHLD